MSIDLAWRYTIGDPSVHHRDHRLGIKWDADDLIETAYLNDRELATHKPTARPTWHCASPADAGAPRRLRLQR